MATSFPTGLDALTNPVSTDTLASPSHADQHANVNDAIEALEAKVGVNGSAVTSSLDYKIANIPATSITSGTLNNARLPAAATTITSVGTLSALRVDGNFGIGINGLAQTGLRISKAISGSAYAQGIYLDGTIQPSVTSRSDTVWSNPSVAASVTLPAINHFYASSSAIGTGSTITTVTGYKAESNLGNNDEGTVTNVYAFSGNIASGTGRWNFFANGTANNYMAGRLGIGLGLTSGAMAQVVNTTAADKAFIIRGAAAQSGSLFEVQNSAGTALVTVNSTGYVGIGTATPLQPAGYGALTIDGSSGSIILGRVAGTETFRIQSTATSTTLNSITALPILFSTTNTERMRITPSGLVGVGVTSPLANLHILTGTATGVSPGTGGRMFIDGNNANMWIDIAGATTSEVGLRFGDSGGIQRGRVGYSNTSDFLDFFTAGAERMRIDSAGNVGIGAAPGTGRSFDVRNNIGGAGGAVGAIFGGSIQNIVTASAQIVVSAPSVIAGHTVPLLYHFSSTGTTLGAGSAVTTQAGFVVQAGMTQATNNRGFWGALASAANTYNLYMSGTAANYMAGRLGVGATLTSGAMAQVTNTTAADKALVVKGAALQSGDFLDVQNSGGTSQFKIASNGNVGIGWSGGTITTAFGSTTQKLQAILAGSAGPQIIAGTYSADAFAPRFDFVKSRNATANTQTIVVSNDSLMDIYASGSDGTGMIPAARIAAQVDGTPGTNDMPGRLIFSTTADGASAPTERMRITSAGRVGIGSSAPTEKLQVTGTIHLTGAGGFPATGVGIELTPSVASGTNYIQAFSRDAGTWQILAINSGLTTFGTAGAERMRITSAGLVGVGVTPTSMFHVVNTIAANKALVVKGAGSQLGNLFEAQNSSGTALVTIDSVGKVGIGNTAPENTLDITGSFGRGNPAVKTANFTLAGTENWIICNGAGTISITLPTPSTCDGREFGIKTVSPQLVNSASSNVIAIGGGAAGTAILPATSGAWAILVSDGASWNIMCRGT